MKTYQMLALGLAAASLAAFSGVEVAGARPAAQPARNVAPAASAAQAAAPAVLAPMLRAVAWRFLLRKVAPPVARYTFKRWVSSGMRTCSGPLPSRYFCSALPRAMRAIVLVGGSGGWVFRSTSEAGATVQIPPWYPIGLSCVTTGQGDASPYGWTNIWYETYDGWYYWQGHLDPYTVTRYAGGLPRC